jgi:tripartite-type tricarboxylate transporter receptor subunit TctC
MIVPFPAGGPTDGLARVVAQKLGESWGQQVVVDNRGGANGIIGQGIAAKAAADGYTLLMQSVAFAINPSLYKLPYDSDRDFTPVILVASTSLVLTAYPGVPAKSVQELIALAKAKPGELAYASFGNGSIAHLAGEMFKSAAGVNLVHVPYKGVPQSIGDLIAGRVQVMFPGISSALPHAEAGRLRILAVTSRQRSQLAPRIPTMIESGVSNFEVGSWFGAFLPAGTPQYVVRRLHGEIERILKLPETVHHFQNQGFEPGGGTPQQFSTFIRGETGKFARVIEAARIKVD